MTKKQELLDEMVRRDKPGSTRRTHDLLVGLGLKWKDRSQTLMYFSTDTNGRELGLIAMRPGLVSFPANFWSSRTQALARAMNSVSIHNRLALDDRWFTSSQYSAGQIALDTSTEATIADVVRDIVVPEGIAAGAKLRDPKGIDGR